MNVIFYPVKDTSTKLSQLYRLAHYHLHQKDPLLLLAADKTSFDFLDKLLWSTPADNFLPHPTTYLAISLELLPHFSTVFNLRPSPLLEASGVKKILEFEDHTSSEKFQLSKQRYQAYRDQNFSITVEI